jgi:hypothetical protein
MGGYVVDHRASGAVINERLVGSKHQSDVFM